MVIASLDRKAADTMLQRLPSNQADAIRRAIMSLSDLDHREQQAAIRDFLTQPVGKDQAKQPAERAVVDDRPISEPVRSASPAVQELQTLSDDAIAEGIYHERIATICAVVAVLPGRRAARIIRQLDPEKQPRVLNALGQGIVPNAPAVEVAARHIADHYAQSAKLGLQHRDALQAILDEVGAEEQQKMLEDLARTNPLLAKRLGWQQYAGKAPS